MYILRFFFFFYLTILKSEIAQLKCKIILKFTVSGEQGDFLKGSAVLKNLLQTKDSNEDCHLFAFVSLIGGQL